MPIGIGVAKLAGKLAAGVAARQAAKAAAARLAAQPAWRATRNPDAWRTTTQAGQRPAPPPWSPRWVEVAKGVEFNVWVSAGVGGGSKLVAGKPDEVPGAAFRAGLAGLVGGGVTPAANSSQDTFIRGGVR